MPGSAFTAEKLDTLDNSLLGGLFSLDPLLLIIELVNVLSLFALYVALNRVNESFALVGLVLGMIALIAVIVSRPFAELVYLREMYSSATDEAIKSR